MNRVAVIMAGGSGERFWPLSTAEEPKQLLRLTNSGKMLLEEAVDRVAPLVGIDGVYVSTSRMLGPKIVQSGIVDAAHVLDEPIKRNTLGAVLWSMSRLERHFGEPFTAAFTTADHLIEPDERFQDDLLKAMGVAEMNDCITIIGIPPTRAEIGFGYMEAGEDGAVARFTEKPDLATAEEYVRSGQFLWNSGMFIMTSTGLAKALDAIDPILADTYQRLLVDDLAFEDLESKSFDFAVLERAPGIRYVPATFRWDDIGAWDSLLRTTSLDAQGNAVNAHAQVLEADGNVIYSSKPGMRVSLLGVTNLAVVVTETEVVVFDLNRSQDVRRLAQP